MGISQVDQTLNNRRGVWLTLGAGVVGAVALTAPVWLIFGPPKPADSVATVPQPQPVSVPQPSVAVEPPAPAAPPPDHEPKAPPTRRAIGFTLHGYEGDELTADTHIQAIDAMADSGATALQFVVPIFTGHARSNTVQLLIGPGRSVPPQRIVAILQHAKLRQLHTTLAPVLILAQPRSVHEWRGAIDPTDWDQWWRNYQTVLDQLIGLANQAGVDAICVGNELWSTERQTQRWVDLVAHVRSGFRGHIYYATTPERREVPAFWSHVDCVGMNIGTEDRGQSPRPAALTQLRDELIAFADMHDRPLIVTHVSDREQPPATNSTLAHEQSEGRNQAAFGDLPAIPTNLPSTLPAFVESWRPLVAPIIATGSHEPDDRRQRIAGLFLDRWPLPTSTQPPDPDAPSAEPVPYADVRRFLQRLLEEQP